MSQQATFNNVVERCSLLDVTLAFGDTLQLQDSIDPKNRYAVSLIGLVNRKSIVISAPFVEGNPMLPDPGRIFEVRGFSERTIYQFTATVIAATQNPYPHLHISFPAHVEVTTLRAALRIRPKLSCFISSADSPLKMPAMIEDISTSGARIQSRKQLGQEGDQVALGFQVMVDSENMPLTISAIIRNVSEQTDAAGDEGFHHGVEFIQSHGPLRMALQSYIYRTMAGN
jgi:c-di-GMP-binding flagellar brake protein YcgR